MTATVEPEKILKELAALPPSVVRAWRRFPLDGDQLEASSVARTLEEILRIDPPLARFNGSGRGFVP